MAKNGSGDAWSGRLGFILATVGSAVGIGSIWKFPYEVGANGGSAFLIFYLLGLALIVVPLMFAEFAIGRRGQGDAPASIAAVAAEHGAARAWALAGLLGTLTAFLILSYYSVIGGWTIAYAIDTAIEGLAGTEPAAVVARYDDFLASPLRLAAFHGLFMGLSALVVARGVHRGIEAAAKFLMPLLGVLMIGLAAYSLLEGDLETTLAFLFELDPQRLTAQAALEALGLGFFSISVGFGLMITFAAYAGREISLREVAVVSVLADTAISFLAGFAVFPIVFAHGLDPAAGAGLVFVTLPLAFADIPFGRLAAVAFFILLFVAALASAISMLELPIAWLLRRGWSRPRASLAAGGACFVAGLGTVFSFNLWAGWHPLAAVDGFGEATLFDLLDYGTSNLLLPVAGLAIAIFAGWIVPAHSMVAELRLSRAGERALAVMLRYVVPIGIAAVGLGPVLY